MATSGDGASAIAAEGVNFSGGMSANLVESKSTRLS